MVKRKKGQEFSVTTLVVIVLAIIVLVVLALGFGAGWGNLWSRITGYFSPVNVDSVKQACSYACSTQATFAYCCQVRGVVVEVDGKKDAETYKSETCKSLESQNLAFEACTSVTCSTTSCPAASCKGKATDCPGLSQTDCPKQKPCTWDATKKCQGTATDCPGLSQTACTQKGCTWS